VVEVDDSEPIQRKVEWPDEPPRPLTQRQQMIVAITRRRCDPESIAYEAKRSAQG